MKPAFLLAITAALAASTAFAAESKRIPPPGIAVPDADRAELTDGVAALGKEIESVREARKAGPERSDEMPNVEIFHKAVDWALRYDEFFDEKQLALAKEQLAQGLERAAALRKGQAPWNSASGLVLRAYRSKIDGSVQPYGLVIPPDWKPGDNQPRRLDFWCHGRGEKLSELAFVAERQRSAGEFTPEGAIVCHLYGRYCNANKFAGEVDLFEALDDIQQHYKIDKSRLVVRGFSMGGAACWQFATHYPGMWAAAAPGAGFAETAEFFKVFAPGKTPPPWWEQVLWRWYDCTTMAANLANVPTVAYSGEFDGQKQAADIMVKYAKQEGVEFPHIIGAKMGHKYDAESKVKIEELIAETLDKRSGAKHKSARFVTYSPLYGRSYSRSNPLANFQIRGLDKSWERAEMSVVGANGSRTTITTKNVRDFVVDAFEVFLPGVNIDGQDVRVSVTDSGRRRFAKEGGIWVERDWVDRSTPFVTTSLRKNEDTPGPIDHAFMRRFVFVKPTGVPMNQAVGQWTETEFDHAVDFWRRVFRGDAPIVTDLSIAKKIANVNSVSLSNDPSSKEYMGQMSDILDKNLILWGDPSSNAVLKRIIEKLPIKWTKDTLEFNGVKYDAANHAPILIFPNPLNPQKYIVLNSGPTFREEALLNNSDQTPKLPDWAIVNLDTPPDGKWPGQIIDAGFFDEQWALPKK